MTRLEQRGRRRPEKPIEPPLVRSRDLLGFVGAALARRKLILMSVWVLVAGLGIAAAVLLPRTYSARARILAQSNVQLPALANPRRAIPFTSDQPTRSVAAILLSQQSLERLILETDLMARWDAQRPPVLKAKDRVVEWIRGPLTDDDKKDALVKVLKRRLWVNADDDVVTIGASWTDPDTPVLLVGILEQFLLEDRRSRENGTISDALGILQGHASDVKRDVDRSLAHLQELRETHLAEKEQKKPQRERQMRTVSRPNPRAVELRQELAEKRRAITEVESLRERRLTDLRATLGQRRVELGPKHPDIIGLERQIARLESDSPELERLKRQERDLRRQYLAVAGDRIQATVEVGSSSAEIDAVMNELARMEPDEEENPEISYARAQLEIAISKYEDLLERIAGARIELDTANAAFKYRYSTIEYPKRPREPDKPSVPIAAGGALGLGLLLGLTAAVGREILSRRLLMPWQVERFVSLPVLGEAEIR